MLTIYNQALGLAALLLLGYVGGVLARKVKLPMVAGYVVMGLIIGPSVLHIIPEKIIQEFELIKILGLGLIALVIGGELEIKRIKHLGKIILGTTIIQVIGVFLVVFVATFYLLKLSLPISLLLSAMATATAPAASVAVIREYQAQGPFTTTLLGIVALDDAACIIIFGIIAAISRMLLDGTLASGLQMFTAPAIELLGSLGVGFVVGLLMIYILRHLHDKQHRLTVIVGLALLNSGIAAIFDLSPLLINMTTGFIYTNLSLEPQALSVIDEIDFPIFVVFFTLAGTSLRLDVLAASWVAALVYIVARGIGKIGGCYVGAKLSGASEAVQRYLGLAMLPKAGVTIGLVMLVQGRFPEIAAVITAIELAAVTVCELIGPLTAKYALVSAGEAKLPATKASKSTT